MQGQKVFSNLLWRFFERCGAQLVTIIVSIILARLLDPEVYGVVAIVNVVITILQVFVDSGLGSALVQKKDADHLDFSTVFYFNVVICILMYAILFFIAPIFANFYGRQELTALIRVSGLILIVSGVKNIQQAYVSRNMMFKRFFFATLGGTIAAAVFGIALAYAGYGAWALVGQLLLNTTVDTIILWITVKWRPKKEFSFERLKGLFSYGWKLLVSSLVNNVYNQIRQLIIGKKYSTLDLSYYNKGDLFPNTIVNNINTAIDSVLLPSMSSEQDDKERVKAMTRRAIRVSSYTIWPLMMGLAAAATPIVSLLLTDKWLPCVPYLQIFCFTYAFYPIHTSNLNAIKAIGRSDLYLKLEILKAVAGFVILLATMWFGVLVMAYSMLLSSIVSQIINAWPNKKLLNYGYKQQIKDILPTIGLSVAMGAIVYCVTFLGLSNIVTLIIQIVLGIVIYILGSKLFKFEQYYYVISIIKGLFKRKEEKNT